MRKGITSTIIFHLSSDISVEDIADARITVCQGSHTVANHNLAKLTVNSVDNTMQMTLTQEEALTLLENRPAEVQLKVKFIGGTVLATPIYRTSVRAILNEEVI